MKPTIDEIRQARTRAEDIGTETLERRFSVDWNRANRDRRKGNTHAWTRTGEYLGQLRGHAQALDHGATVTKFDHVWFAWGID